LKEKDEESLSQPSLEVEVVEKEEESSPQPSPEGEVVEEDLEEVYEQLKIEFNLLEEKKRKLFAS